MFAVLERAVQQFRYIPGIKGLEHVRTGARQQGVVQGEGRVFGGGADENQRAVLDKGQERILLGLVEPVHFIEEQHRRPVVVGANHLCVIDG